MMSVQELHAIRTSETLKLFDLLPAIFNRSEFNKVRDAIGTPCRRFEWNGNVRPSTKRLAYSFDKLIHEDAFEIVETKRRSTYYRLTGRWNGQ
jgi:hypothetical protein